MYSHVLPPLFSISPTWRERRRQMIGLRFVVGITRIDRIERERERERDDREAAVPYIRLGRTAERVSK
uniref:Uncharacterized protein n=1 Tax=Caenorhabditis tropicalis TaxID=1561998 RepID=A0A1I7U578_9PELO